MFDVMGIRPSLVRGLCERLVVLGDKACSATPVVSHRVRRGKSASVDSRGRRDVIIVQARPWERHASSKVPGQNALERKLSAGR